jgi:enamine deaminase RidA (YjgF/YER057c/UK114 family)
MKVWTARDLRTLLAEQDGDRHPLCQTTATSSIGHTLVKRTGQIDNHTTTALARMTHNGAISCSQCEKPVRCISTKCPARYPMKVRFRRSVVVGNYVFVSGSSGQTAKTFISSSGDVGAQTEVAHDRVRGAIEEAGSSMKKLVKVVVYLTRAEARRHVEG